MAQRERSQNRFGQKSALSIIKDTSSDTLAGLQAIEKLYHAAKYEECVSACLAHIAESAQGKEIILFLARSLANLGRLDEAGGWMSKLIEKDSADAQNYYFYASILIEQGLWDEAGRNLTKALYLQPDHLAAQLSMGQVLKRLGKTKQAQRLLNNLIRDMDTYDDDTMIPSLDGMTAGRMREIARMLEGGLS